MAILDESRLEKNATEIVDGYFNNKIALTDSVADVAENQSLNDEQIKRLVEAVNNMTFMRRFDGAEDRMAASEFQPADANAAISRMIDAARDLMDTAAPDEDASPCSEDAMDLLGDLPNTRSDLDPLPDEVTEEPGETPVNGTIMIMRLRKTASVLRDQEYQARVHFTEAFQKLATDFRRVGSKPYEAFEQDAFYKWGERAAPYLNTMRQALRLVPAYYDTDTLYKVARVIDSTTPRMRQFNALMQHSEKAKMAGRAYERVQEHLAQAEELCR